MAEVRNRHDWAHTSSLMALIANTNRDPKKHRAFQPRDFDPFTKTMTKGKPKVDVSILKEVFIDNPNQRPQVKQTQQTETNANI